MSATTLIACDLKGECRPCEKLTDKSFSTGGRKHDALDCRVYNLCAGDVFLDMKIKEMRDYYRTQEGWNAAQLQKIEHNFVLGVLTRAMAPRQPKERGKEE